MSGGILAHIQGPSARTSSPGNGFTTNTASHDVVIGGGGWSAGGVDGESVDGELSDSVVDAALAAPTHVQEKRAKTYDERQHAHDATMEFETPSALSLQDDRDEAIAVLRSLWFDRSRLEARVMGLDDQELLKRIAAVGTTLCRSLGVQMGEVQPME
jgi:hypothetical protein